MGAFSRIVTINNVKKYSPGTTWISKVYKKESCFSIHTHKKAHLFFTKKPLSVLSFDGSITVEASLVLPIFLLCIMNILFLFQAIETESRVTAALHQTGNEIAFLGYASQAQSAEGTALSVLSTVYAKSDVNHRLGAAYLSNSCIRGDLIFLGSSILDGDQLVDLKVKYLVKPFLSGFGMKDFVMSGHYYGRAWTGYEPANYSSDLTKDDPMVYITQTGTVYHTNRYCTHLNPSVSMVLTEEVGDRRNESGSRYYPCEICGGYVPGAYLYLTDQGTKYHTSLSCSGIKRTIFTVALSEVGGRRKCLKCA